MAKDWASLKARWRGWETYTHHFITYILQAPSAHRVRRQFFQDVLRRTIVYTLFGGPIFGLFYLLDWVSITSLGSILGFAFVTFDLALGLALIQTVSAYRARVELLYRLDSNKADEEEQMPMTHRVVWQPPAAPTAAERKAARAAATATAPPPPAPESHNAPDPTFDAAGGPVTVECQECQRRMTLADPDALQNTKRCLYCGGAIRAITA